MKFQNITELEALQNAVNHYGLPEMNLTIHEMYHQDKRKTVKMFFIHNHVTKETISPVCNYENMNQFIIGFAKAKSIFEKLNEFEYTEANGYGALAE